MDNFGKPTAPVTPPVNSAPPVTNPGSGVQFPSPAPTLQPTQNPQPEVQPLIPQPIDSEPATPPKKRKKRLWLILLLSLLTLVVATAVAGWFWFQSMLGPVDTGNTEKIKVSIVQGSTPSGIADTLKEAGVIKDQTVFLWYTRFEKVQNTLQAGTYRLSPSETMPEIVEHLINGNTDTFSITFLPGATLAQNRKALIEAGYSEEEVDTGLKASYESPLFAGKPETADLEGYIYGETYSFGTDSSVEEVLAHTFEVYSDVITENGLVAAYDAKGLSLYQGITLASIVQRESIGGDEAQIAQVFYNRLAIDMPLGSDVTYQYIADKLGVSRDDASVIDIDSPYNTRRYPGIPPGPIATPGVAALKAVGSPAEGDYLFFLSGDDDITYFARTNEEHEQNKVNHCQKKCLII